MGAAPVGKQSFHDTLSPRGVCSRIPHLRPFRRDSHGLFLAHVYAHIIPCLKYNGVRPHGKEVVHFRNAFRCRSANSLRPPTQTSCGDDLRSRGNATNTMGLDPVAHKSYVPHVITFAISRSSHICHLLAIPALNRQFAASHYLSSAQSSPLHQPRHTIQTHSSPPPTARISSTLRTATARRRAMVQARMPAPATIASIIKL